MSSPHSPSSIFRRDDSFNSGWSNCMSNALCKSVSWTSIALTVVLVLLLIANFVTKKFRKSSGGSRNPLRRRKAKSVSFNNTEFIPLAEGPQHSYSNNGYSHNIEASKNNDDLFSMLDPKAYANNAGSVGTNVNNEYGGVRASMTNIPIVGPGSSIDNSIATNINEDIGHVHDSGKSRAKGGYQMV